MPPKKKTPAVDFVTEPMPVSPDLKKVMDRETRAVVIIDANKEPDRKKKFLHCSWIEFDA